MRKTRFLRAICIFFLLLSIARSTAVAGQSTSDSYSDNSNKRYGQSIKVFLDGKDLQCEVPPILENGYTLIPFRAIFEALGAEVSWLPEKQRVRAIKEDTSIELTIGSYEAKFNNSNIRVGFPPKIVEERVLVPLRFVSEAMGCLVVWDGANQAIYIYTDTVMDKKPLPEFKLSNNDYTKDNIRALLWNLPIHSEFAESHVFSPNLQNNINKYLIWKAAENSISFDEINPVIEAVKNHNKDRIYLICYVEKSFFEGHSAWLVVTNWAMPNEPLGHIQVFAIDNIGKIIYFDTCR